MNSLRVTVKEDETFEEVDLSKKYFNLQMKRSLGKEPKSIKIRVSNSIHQPSIRLVEYKTWLTPREQRSAS